MKMIPKQQGSAIVVALFVVALVAAIATAMLIRLQQDTRRTQLLVNATQANFYAQGSVAWATDQLINDWKSQQQNKVIDRTPIISPKNKQNSATIQTTITDAQGLFNLNNLTDQKYRENFGRLIKTLQPSLSANDIQTLVQATTAWISSTSNNDAFDTYYSKLSYPYKAPHHIMASMSELRLVKGMTPALFKLISPYVIALPMTTAININNADAPVLMSMSPTLTLDAAKGIVAHRTQTPFTNVQNFQAFDIVKNNSFAQDQVTTTSNYFLVKTEVSIGEQEIILYTLLQRDAKDSQASISVLWQSKGTL